MKTSKQINIKMCIVETLDRIREQLPRRGHMLASYGDAINWLDVGAGDLIKRVRQLESEIRILKQKKVRK